MNDIALRLKSGREFRFQCKKYTIKKLKADGKIYSFEYEGGVGECPIYFNAEDIESISIFTNKE